MIGKEQKEMTRKFGGLKKYFDSLSEDSVVLSFSFIEKINAEPLCSSARKHIQYWHPSPTHTITRCWVDNGYKMVGVNLTTEEVSFRKV